MEATLERRLAFLEGGSRQFEQGIVFWGRRREEGHGVPGGDWDDLPFLLQGSALMWGGKAMLGIARSHDIARGGRARQMKIKAAQKNVHVLYFLVVGDNAHPWCGLGPAFGN